MWQRQGAGSHDLWMSFQAGLQPSCFRAIFHELSLSHCLSADNSHCSGWGQGRSWAGVSWRRNTVPSQTEKTEMSSGQSKEEGAARGEWAPTLRRAERS